jgi:class 3 adenylate cyclase
MPTIERCAPLAPARPDHTVTAILFTDMVESTRMLCSLGDALAQPVFDQHRRVLQEAVADAGGCEVQWLGDGMMVVVESVSAAARCACSMRERSSQQQVRGVPLAIRIGLHAGELLRDGEGGFFGSNIVIARRLCDRARAGQILCSHAVSVLLLGQREFDFRKRAALKLKGIAQPLPICELVGPVRPRGLAIARSAYARAGAGPFGGLTAAALRAVGAEDLGRALCDKLDSASQSMRAAVAGARGASLLWLSPGDAVQAQPSAFVRPRDPTPMPAASEPRALALSQRPHPPRSALARHEERASRRRSPPELARPARFTH